MGWRTQHEYQPLRSPQKYPERRHICPLQRSLPNYDEITFIAYFQMDLRSCKP
jgi:hypothetical protein